MKRLLFLLLILFIFQLSNAQEYAKLRHQAIDKQTLLVHVSSKYTDITVKPSNSQSFYDAQVLYMPEVSEDAKKLITEISIEEKKAGDSIFITTVFTNQFDEELLSNLGDNFAINIKVFVSPHMRLNIINTNGNLHARKLKNKINTSLVNSFLSLQHINDVEVIGQDIRLQASQVQKLNMVVSDAELTFSGCQLVNLTAENTSIQSMGFPNLSTTLNKCIMSAGKSKNVTLSARESVIEFTDIEQGADITLEKCKFVLQKMPLRMSLSTQEGETALSLANDRHCEMVWVSHKTKNDIQLRRGTLRLAINAKKTVFHFPNVITKTKNMIECIQIGTHGLKAAATFRRGSLEILR